MTAKVLTAIGGQTLLPLGTASASPQLDAFYLELLSLATAKKTAGEVGPFNQTESRYHPVYTALIRTGTSIAQQRIWVALSSADLSQSDGVGALPTRYIGLRYSTSANDTDWQIASGDGTTGSVLDSGVAVQPNTSYLIQLDWSVDGQLTCQINNLVCGTKTTNLDTGNPTMLGVDLVATTLRATALAQYTAFISLVYDGNNF
jgi:surface antigen